MTDTTIKRPLWIRITAYGFGAVLFASAAIGGTAWYRQAGMNEEALRKELESDIALIETDMAAQRKMASNVVLAIAGEPETVAQIEGNARDEIIARYAASLPQMIAAGGPQLLTFINANGEAVARIHTPDKFGDDMKGRRKTVVTALSSGKLVAGTEPGRTAVSMFASAPVMRDGKVVGVVDAGTSLTNDYFKPLATRIDGEINVHILVEGKLALQASTLGETAFLSEDQLKSVFDGKSLQTQIAEGGRDFAVAGIPFTNFSGDKIGVLTVASNVTPVVAGSRQALWTTAIVTILVALASSLAFLIFARALGATLSRLTGTVSRLANNDLNAPVDGGERQDEIGAMARAVQVLKDNAIRAVELEGEADAQRNAADSERRRAADVEHQRTAAMTDATSALADGLKHLAAGDLSFQINKTLDRDFENLRTDFNLAVSQLRDTMSAVATAGNSIDSGSREISQSADDLSRRTEQQAASLEQTAAALDEITVNVSNSTKRAEEARTVAIQANDSARLSGNVVANAVDAMGKIEKSSGEIGNIIGVIEDIAFQTNLLALNAGVEAARAGEAGKGFAVVAQEVRELAQRSANAAKEIKGLISNSSGEVANGVKLVSQTGEALKTIEGYIVTINQHMDSIATSAREQSVGLSEVNTAVNQMDQVTQQNAAMVEEANAASATLAGEAGRLRELISQFQLGGASGNAASLRSVAAEMAAPRRAAPTPSYSAPARPARAASPAPMAVAAGQDWQEF